MKGGWEAWSKEMQAYCEQDVEVLVKLWKMLEKEAYSEEAVELRAPIRRAGIQGGARGVPVQRGEGRRVVC